MAEIDIVETQKSLSFSRKGERATPTNRAVKWGTEFQMAY
jgi:hypothetical protein